MKGKTQEVETKQSTGKLFDADTIDTEESAPVTDGKFLTQRVSSVVGLVRDRFMVGVISERLADCDSVVVVNGASHLMTQKAALDAALGLPTFESQ